MNIPCGRDDEARLFENIIKNDRLAQAYIINAPEGMGKKTLTNYILSLLFCDTHSSCGVCPSCKSLEANCHPDAVYLTREADKASLGVDRVRAIKQEVYTKPSMASYKAIVADEMELATDGAQNAMLKMIEEPPERVVFFLLTGSMAPILSTIQSRSVTVNLKPLPPRVLKSVFGADDYLVSISGGNPGKLKKLMDDSEYTDFRDEVADVFFSVRWDEPFSPYDGAKRLDKYKARSREVMEIMLSFARDIYFRKIGLSEDIINKDKVNCIDDFASRLSEAKISNIINHIKDTLSQKGASGNFNMAVTIMLLKCRSEMR